MSGEQRLPVGACAEVSCIGLGLTSSDYRDRGGGRCLLWRWCFCCVDHPGTPRVHPARSFVSWMGKPELKMFRSWPAEEACRASRRGGRGSEVSC